MKMTAEVKAALQVLRDNAENDFELLSINRLEVALTNPPRVEVVDESHQNFNGRRYYKDKKRGYYYDTIGIHQAVWSYYHGDIPFDFNVHHDNDNKDDNQPENLVGKTRAEHAAIHAAKEQPREYICEVCGKVFLATPRAKGDCLPKTCSPKCRAKKNRKPFVDVKITKSCIICGQEFQTSKYQPGETCSRHCSMVLMWQSRRQGLKPRYSQKTETRKCIVCGNDFVTQKRSTAKTCSPACAGIYRSNEWKEVNSDND